MTTSALDEFLESLKQKLPEIVSDKDLVSIAPDIFKSPSTLSRLRASKSAPAHFFLSKSHVRYLRDDILNWMRHRYQKASFDNDEP
jgi:hypothetical protein